MCITNNLWNLTPGVRRFGLDEGEPKTPTHFKGHFEKGTHFRDIPKNTGSFFTIFGIEKTNKQTNKQTNHKNTDPCLHVGKFL